MFEITILSFHHIIIVYYYLTLSNIFLKNNKKRIMLRFATEGKVGEQKKKYIYIYQN